MPRKDWTLLAISFNEGEAMSPVQLQKTLFLLGEKWPADVGRGYYKFVPYYYGPFCRDIYDDADRLALDGLVRVDRTGRWNAYSVTAAGAATATQLARRTPRRAAKYLRAAVDWARPLSFQELVTAIYKEFPSQRERSVFQD